MLTVSERTNEGDRRLRRRPPKHFARRGLLGARRGLRLGLRLGLRRGVDRAHCPQRALSAPELPAQQQAYGQQPTQQFGQPPEWVGFGNYRDYRFKAMKRFDYGPGDCMAFHEAVEFAKERGIAIYARATASPLPGPDPSADGTVVRRHAPRAPGTRCANRSALGTARSLLLEASTV